MPNVVRQAVNRITGEPFTVILEEGSDCRKCVAYNDLQVKCHDLPGCSNGRFVRLNSTASLGPYDAAYRLVVNSHKQPPAPYGVEWEKPANAVRHLQHIIRKNWSEAFFGLQLSEVVAKVLETYGMPEDWHKLALEFPVDGDDSIFYSSSRAGLQRRIEGGYGVSTIPGRYIRRHWPNLTDSEVRNIVAEATNGVCSFTYDMQEMVDAVQSGPESCMQWSETGYDSGRWFLYNDEDRDETTSVHPYHAYDPKYGWGMALRHKAGKIQARALVYEDGPHKCYVRSYGRNGDDPALESLLQRKGYERKDAWPEGAKLAYNKNEEGIHVVPYADPGPNRREKYGERHTLVENPEGENFWVRDNAGPYTFTNTDGSTDYEPIKMYTCSVCGKVGHEHKAHSEGHACHDCLSGDYRIVRNYEGLQILMRHEFLVLAYDGEWLLKSEVGGPVTLLTNPDSDGSPRYARNSEVIVTVEGHAIIYREYTANDRNPSRKYVLCDDNRVRLRTSCVYDCASSMYVPIPAELTNPAGTAAAKKAIEQIGTEGYESLSLTLRSVTGPLISSVAMTAEAWAQAFAPLVEIQQESVTL